jgi:hypothetical protein
MTTSTCSTLRFACSEHRNVSGWGSRTGQWPHSSCFALPLFRGYADGKNEFADGFNRFITVLFYLSTVEDGGETVFPLSGDSSRVTNWADCTRGLKIAPHKGDAVIFYNLLESGVRAGIFDPSSLHGSCDVRGAASTKW